MGQIDAITQYVLALAPAVTAIVAMAVTIAVGVGKIKKALSGSEEKIERIGNKSKAIEQQNAEIKRQNIELKRENAELKKTLADFCNKIEIIDTIKAVNKKE